MSKSPSIPVRRWAAVPVPAWWLGVLAVLFAILVVFSGIKTFRTDPETYRTLGNVGVALQQQQAANKASGIPTVGPPAESILDGNATPPPTDKVPTEVTTVINRTITATQSQIRAGVEQWFEQHPIPPGQKVDRKELAARISAEVTRYLTAHPPQNGANGHNGTNGLNGSPGPAPTDEQIAAAVTLYLPGAVEAYMIEHPAPAGPAGPSGVAGPSGAPCDPAANPACVGPSGARGPGPTPEQMRDAVADYLASHGVPCGDGTARDDVTFLDTTGQTRTIRGCFIPPPAS